MEAKKIKKHPKKSYYLPVKLTDYLAKAAKPGRDYSPKVAAGILLWLSLDQTMQKIAEVLAEENNIESAIQVLSEELAKHIIQRAIADKIADLSPEQLAQILAGIKPLTEVLAH